MTYAMEAVLLWRRGFYTFRSLLAALLTRPQLCDLPPARGAGLRGGPVG